VRSIRTADFIKQLDALPVHVQEQARAGFQLWKQDPLRVGWHRLQGVPAPIYAAEIGLRWRALAVVDKATDTCVWSFIGSHETYNKVIERYRHTPPRVRLR